MLAAWLATYIIHSTVLLGAVWIFQRIGGRRAETWSELTWRAALFGSVVTSILQTALIPLEPDVARTLSPASLGARSLLDPALISAAVACWITVAAVRLLVLLYRTHIVRSAIRRSSRSADDALSARVREVTGVSGVRVLVSAQIATPLVIGARELCVPARMLRELSSHEIDAALAHEVAHVVRRDPQWLMLAAIVSRVLFVQPLNVVAMRRLRAIAEWSSDDWAVARTKDPVALASALARVAEWVLAVPSPTLLVAMAGRESLALARVRRILANRSSDVGRPPRWATALVIAMLSTTVLALPGVSASAFVVELHTVNAFDDAGPFSLTLDRGVVVAATTDGIPLPAGQIEQRGRRVRVTDAHGGVLALTLTGDGGFRWTSRPARPLATR